MPWVKRRGGILVFEGTFPEPPEHELDAYRPRPDLAPCGTPTAARRHYKRGEKPCAKCRKADAAARAVRKRTRDRALRGAVA